MLKIFSNVVLRRSEMITISDMRRDRGRIKNILITIINKRFNTLNLPKCMICHISQWQQMIIVGILWLCYWLY